MAKRVKRRAVYVHVGKREQKQIRELSKYVPSLEKYKGMDKLTPAQYGAFTKAKSKLHHRANLKPVTAAQAKKLHKDQLAGGGVRAVRLRNTEPGAEVTFHKGGMIVESNGRDFEYHTVDSVDPASLMELAGRLLEKADTTGEPAKRVYLYQSRGRMDQGFSNLPAFSRYVRAFFNKYQEDDHNAEDFILGVVALVKDNNHVPPPSKPARQTKRQKKRGRR